MSELAERRIPVSTVMPEVTDSFISALIADRDDQSVLATIEELLDARRPREDPSIELVNAIIADIERSKGMTTVARLAGEYNMSERALQNIFRIYVGVGPKWTIMRSRFLEVIHYARSQDRPDWTLIAAEFGYSDQSHFINDFKRLVGQSPFRYMRY